MKKVYLQIVLFIWPFILFGQSFVECTGIFGNPPPTPQIKSSFVYDPNTTMKYIKVNIHYMLKSNGTGNFTETSDGMVSTNSPYNGYTYAELLMNTVNQFISVNPQMKLPPNNTTPNYPIKYRYILSGVYFHRNSDFYYYPQDLHNIMSIYGVNAGSEINIFLENANGAANGGHANTTGSRYVEMRGVWEMYSQHYYTNKLISTGAFASTLGHELGHNLGLTHTMRYYNGPCCPTTTSTSPCGDDCDDTPTRDQMLLLGIDPCCGSGVVSPTCDNNLMNYSGEQALTPCQLSKIFDNFTKDATSYGTKAYLACNFTTDVLNLCSIGTNQFYNAKSINFPSVGCTNGIVPIGQHVTLVAKDNIFLNCGFEVPLSSQFEALILNACQ